MDNMLTNIDGKTNIFIYQMQDFVVTKYANIIKKKLFNANVSEYEFRKKTYKNKVQTLFCFIKTAEDLGILGMYCIILWQYACLHKGQ